MLSIRRWHAAHLFAAWVAYWVLLVLVALGRPLRLVRRIAALPEGRSSASASFGDGGLDARMIADGATLWHGHASYGAVVLWVVLPPLLLWLVWVAMRPTRAAAAPPPRALGAGEPELERTARRERARERR